MKVVPRTGMVVIDPATSQPLPVSGASVEMDSYWVRRLNDGDVTEAEEQQQPKAEMPRAQRRTKTKGTRGHVDGDLIQ